jgi:undecaprenyl-diphosphatase
MDIVYAVMEFDKSFLLLLNGLNTPFLDHFMLLVSNKWVWVPFYATVIFIVARYYKKDVLFILPALILFVVFADQISSGFFKDFFQRLRPTREEDLLPILHIVNGYKGGGMYGFVSSHAANTFGFAVLTALLFKDKFYGYMIFAWAIIVSYSRIYLAVHYPFDVLGGFVVGTVVAFAIYKLLSLVNSRLIKTEEYGLSTKIPVYMLIVSFALIILYSAFLLI